MPSPTPIDREVRLQLSTANEIRYAIKEFEAIFAQRERVEPRLFSSLRRRLNEHMHEHSARFEDRLVPELRDARVAARELRQRHSDYFRPPMTTDADLIRRLAAIGEYDLDYLNDLAMTEITWAEPDGLSCDWTRFTLSMWLPEGDDSALTRLLDAVELLLGDFPQREQQLRCEVLGDFAEDCRDSLLRDCEKGADGRPTERWILSQIEAGSILVTLGQGSRQSAVYAEVHIPVEWDSEHGFDTEWLILE